MIAQARSRMLNLFYIFIFLVGMLLTLVACSSGQIATPAPTPDCPVLPAQDIGSFEEKWKSSPHADESSEAFRHWDAEDPREIPVGCAGCHSRPGFVDLMGIDGSSTGVVDKPVNTGTTLTCFICHNEITNTMDSLTFPSGKRVGGLGSEALCIRCHQGRASTDAVNVAIRKSGITEDDLPSAELAFVNSHFISGATPFGSEVSGAYEYNGKVYKGRYTRGGDFFACIRCHEPHSLELKVETCKDCHTFDGIDPKTIRVNTTDFDGNGNIIEGIAYEVEGMHSALYKALQDYAATVIGVPIVYDPSYPYFYIDLNNNGVADTAEVNFGNRYNQFSPRLLRAAYNYAYVTHDAGAYSHNSIYIFQILYDSLADLGGDTTGITRP